MGSFLKKIDYFFITILSISIFFAYVYSPLSFDVYAQEEQVISQNLQDLQQELKDLEKQIAAYQKDISSSKQKRVALTLLIEKLKIHQAQVIQKIRETEKNLSIVQNELTKTKVSIEDQKIKIMNMKEKVSGLFRLLQETQDHSFLEAFMVYENISEYVDDIQQQESLMDALRLKLQEVHALKQGFEEKKQTQEDQENTISHLLNKQLIKRDELTDTVRLQTSLREETQRKELVSTQNLKVSKEKIAQIKSRIYELFNVGKQINFGEAYRIAKFVSDQTGVRPAFLLAILTQESNLGKNVGTCNRVGDPPTKGWRSIMKPSRDQEPFLQITEELGLDPDTTPVSCPMIRNGEQIGWGGAMGPAQFIPSTWMGYRDKVKVFTGKSSANPWDIRDAFIASAIKLKAGGANGTRKGESAAALRYFSGSTDSKYSFYSNSVLALADRYQKDIDDLESEK